MLPTDTMKNTVYALAARDGVGEPEAFGLRARPPFHRAQSAARAACVVDLADHGWNHIAIGDREHGQAFVRRGPDTRTARVVTERASIDASPPASRDL